MKFLILNGPNINLARWTEPGVPGEVDYTGLMDYVQAGCDQLGIETDICQSNHEGDLIDEIQSAPGRVDGIVLTPAFARCSAYPSSRAMRRPLVFNWKKVKPFSLPRAMILSRSFSAGRRYPASTGLPDSIRATDPSDPPDAARQSPPDGPD